MPPKVNRTKRVLYVESSTSGIVGGSYYSLYYLVKQLDRQRFEPLVAFYEYHPIVEEFAKLGCEIIPLFESPLFCSSSGPACWIRKRRSGLMGFLLAVLRRSVYLPLVVFPRALVLSRWARQRHVDLFHLNDSTRGNREGLLAAALAGLPSVSHERAIRDYSMLDRWLIQRAGAMICISDEVKKHVYEKGLHPRRIFSIHNGVSPKEFVFNRDAEAIRRELGIALHVPLIGTAGRLIFWKGQDQVIQAVDLLRREFPDIRCLIVGSACDTHDAYVRKLRLMVYEMGLSENVLFLGQRSDLPDLLNALDVFVHAPTRPEPFGRVLLEAMVCSRPVVAVQEGAIPEIVKDGCTGLLVPPGDPEALAAGIVTLLKHPLVAAAMGHAGRRRTVAMFSIEQHVQAIQATYDQVLSQYGEEEQWQVQQMS